MLKKKFYFIFCIPVLIVLIGVGYGCWNCVIRKTTSLQKEKKTIYGIGYVRGSSMVTLKNKYAGFVSKVNCFSQQRVRKGAVILTYDDFDIRKKILDVKHDIVMQKEVIAEKELVLQLKRLDPLPSNYRNLDHRQSSAQAVLARLKHEEEVYERLYKVRAVSDLSLREKHQSVCSSEAELNQIVADREILQKGLSELYIKLAEQDLQNAKQHLENLKQDLVLLEEEQKYYRIVAPYDGLCITNSDTVHAYNSAGTAAAVVHQDKKKLVYAYFREEDIACVKENVPCTFRSNQYPDADDVFQVTPYEVKKERSSYGDNCYYLVKCRVGKEHKPLRIDSTGRVEITVSRKNFCTKRYNQQSLER